MRTNSKQVRQAIDSHILDSVTDFNGNNFLTIQEAAKHLHAEFVRVANYPYNLKMIPNNQDRFSDYLCGLPFNFYYLPCDISDFLDSLGINPSNKIYSPEKSLKLYHYLIYSQTIKNI